METKGKYNDLPILSKIGSRAVELLELDKSDKLGIIMDIDAIYKDYNLDLERLINFPDFDFAHDIVGIMNNLNRSTGKLENCFSPRCTRYGG